MKEKQHNGSWRTKAFWVETLGWQSDERMDHVSQENMKVLTWVYVVEFFLMGLYQIYLTQYQVAVPLLVIATAISLWFAWQHQRYGDDEYGLAQLGKQYTWSGGLFAVGGVFGFLAALIVFDELNILWTLVIFIPSMVVVLRSRQQQLFEKRTKIFLALVSIVGGVVGFLFAIGMFGTLGSWLFLAALAAFFAATYWLYIKQ